ncbi:Outer membrane protein beta-barrel domain-containing protein [Algoriphagus ornithinivorans]|uniref:Outer membrane protein beta-barrel domain-containing protein n=1 Tax=Algoriphagus ornithinivorans TaxID=226506 RepID=A0A1I5A8S4_9BACT|nr:porin family protein [Algoriphagus ornithinivorans]SFN58833.1 Outer membrane protein beta-barrel domain-containing protein [Algoriphagus ornithinivorans]
MKKFSALFTLFLICAIPAFSQNFGLGIKAGLSSTEVDFKSEEFIPSDSQLGYHVGLFARFGGAGFFVQPEFLFTQTSGEFIFRSNPQAQGEKFEANFNRLDIPLMLGFRVLKVLRVQAGPIASLNIDSNLKNAGGTVQDAEFSNATLGYQAGLGVDIGNLSIDGKYEGGLSKFTDNISSFQTDNRINQWVLSVGFRLF